MTVLARYHIQYPGTTPWVDVTGRVIDRVRWSEGRNLTLLGGPLPPAVPATLNCTLDNFDGHFTKGAGSTLGPGARFRLQWRATTGDAWVTRYIGRLSEQRVRFQGSSRIAVRWYGILVSLTAGELPPRSYGSGPPQRTIGLMCDTVGVAIADRDFDTDTANFPFTATEPGHAGVRQFENLVNGFIHDTPDGKVRLELPPTRAAKTVSATYSDVPAGAEIGIPPPEVQTNPFGIINHVTGELRVFSPTTGDTGVTISLSTLPNRNQIVTYPAWQTYVTVWTLDFEPSESVIVSEWTIGMGNNALPPQTMNSLIVRNPDTSGERTFVRYPNVTWHMAIRNVEFVIAGNIVRSSFEFRGYATTTPPATDYSNSGWRVNISSITVFDLYSVLQHEETYTVEAEDITSQALHGITRGRMSPIVTSQFTADLSNFTPDLTFLETTVQAELDRFKNPQEVYILDTTAATDAERTALLARRLSDKVHLRLAGPSQLSVDADFFVEAMETTIDPVGNVAQRLHVVEGPPPQLAAPTGLALTEASGDITAAWNAVADATGYVLEWREEGSGDVWQTIDVTTPPHRFTP